MRVTRVVTLTGGAVLAGLGALLASCSTSASNAGTTPASFACTSYGAHDCANDPAPADTDVTDCQAAEDDPLCGSEATAALACEQGTRTCDASGLTDSFALQQTCAPAYAAYTLCASQKETDGGTAVSGIVVAGYGGEGNPAQDTCASVSGDDDDDGTQIDFGDPPCDQCMAEICCAPVSACAASASCRALTACFFACATGDETCSDACAEADVSFGADSALYAAVDACRNASCTSDGGVGSCN